MAEHEDGSIVARLESIERTIQQLTQRIHALEHSANPALPQEHPQGVHPPAAIPHFTRVSASPPTDADVPAWIVKSPPPPPSPPKTRKQVDDLEYKIGLTGLLRGGAVVIVIAIIYLVSLAVSRGYITPKIQFAGEIALCLSFIGLGIVNRNVREEFGQLMMGIGSCGLYLSFAAAHLSKHLYSGETLVTLFIALSFVNLGFSFGKSSKSFLAIGMIGGLTAAMLPMHQYKAALDIALHFLILVPCALIVVKNRWSGMAIALWAASTAALIPALSYESVWMVRIGGLYGASLICAATYGIIWSSENDFDPWCGLSAGMIAVAGIAGLIADEIKHGSLHVLVLASASALIALGFKGRPAVRNAMLIASLAVAASLSPVGFDRLEAGSAFAAFSILFALISLRAAPKALTALAGLQLALGLCAYTAPWTNSPLHFGVGAETWLLTALMAATVATAFACQKAGGAAQSMMLLGCFLAFPLFTRLGFILLTASGAVFVPPLALLIPFLIYSIGMLTVGKKTRWSTTLAFGWITLLFSMLAYSQLVSDGFRSTGIDSLVVFSMIGVVLYAACASRESAGEGNIDLLVGGSGALIAVLVIRLTVLWLMLPAVHLKMTAAMIIGLLIVTGLSASLAIRFKWVGLVPQGWLALIPACFGTLLLQELQKSPVSVEYSLLTACILGVLMMVYCTSRYIQENAAMTGACIASIWVLFSRLAYVALTSSFVGLKDAPAVTFPWIVYAIILLSLGFRFQARHLRYWSFGVFGTTLAKIFLFDLSDLDPGIRVALLFLLGLGMVGGGYWYIRTKSKAVIEETAT